MRLPYGLPGGFANKITKWGRTRLLYKEESSFCLNARGVTPVICLKQRIK